MTALTKNSTLGDAFKNMISPQFNLVSGTFRNNSGASRTITGPCMMVVKLSSGKYVPVLSTDEANAGGLLFYQDDIGVLANSTDFGKKVPILVRGPAVINGDDLPTADIAGTTYDTLAEIKTALLALGIVCVDEPDKVATQTN